MKSLFIVNDFPPILGGQSSYLYNLCRAFPKDKIVVLAPLWKGCEAFDEKQKFSIIRRRYVFSIPYVEKILKIIFSFIYAVSILKKHNIERIHCGHVLSTGVVGLILKKFFKKQYYVYTYSADIMEYQKYRIIKRLLMTILHNASKVMAISQYNKDKLLELGVSSDKIITIMPKIDFDKFRNFLDIGTLIEKYHLNDKKIILSVNRLVERKGNDMVIKAFLKIKNKVSHAVYVIVGSGEYEEDLKKLVEQYHLSNDVLFISSVSDEDVLRFYNLCDVFVMLSREIKEKGDAEGFGIVFLEANACGKPVVGGDSGGMRDAVIDGETGILVNPCNTDQISEAIIKLLEDEEYAKKLGENGRARVENQFDWRVGQEELKELNF